MIYKDALIKYVLKLIGHHVSFASMKKIFSSCQVQYADSTCA